MSDLVPWTHQINLHRIVVPAAIAGVPNGKLPDAALAPVHDGHGKVIGKLEATCAARAWNAMAAAAIKEGVNLSAVSTYRSLDDQIALLHERYDHVDHGRGGFVYAGERWFLKPGYAPIAVPGTSWHCEGLAVDDDQEDPAVTPWLEAHAHTYGFEWELRAEVWHVHYWPGDSIPQAVLDYEASLHPATSEEDAMLYEVTDGNDAGVWFVQGNVRRKQTTDSAQHLIAGGVPYRRGMSGEGFAQIAAATKLNTP